MEQSGRKIAQPRAERVYAKSARLLANACLWLQPSLPTRDGKEGVDGSSPSEGSAKAPHVGAFSFRPTRFLSNMG